MKARNIFDQNKKYMKLAYLYTQSELTPWKENVNMNTLQFLMAHTPANIDSEIVHFDGFNDDLLDRLREFDLVFIHSR